MSTPHASYKLTWALAAGRCAFPECRQQVALHQPGGAPLLQGEIAHIVSETPGGPRGQYPPPGGSVTASANFLLLCFEHHNEIDRAPERYSVAKLVGLKADHERWVRETLDPRAVAEGEAAPLSEETLHSSLLPIDVMPKVVFAAPCSKSEKEVRERLVFPKQSEVAFPYLVRGSDLLTFCNLADPLSPFAPLIDAAKVKRHLVSDWMQNTDKARWVVDLLNRATNRLASMRRLRFDKEHRRYYFPLADGGCDRTEAYTTLGGRHSSRSVAWRPRFKHNGELRSYYTHLAASLRYHYVGDGRWFLSIRPEWRFTIDGEKPLQPKTTGRRATKAKSRMYNGDYVDELQFWRDYLANGTPRIVVHFGSQSLSIDNKPLEVHISWPGVTGDAPRNVRVGHDDDLFTGAEYAAIIREATEQSQDAERGE